MLNAGKTYNNQLLRKDCVDVRRTEDKGKDAVFLSTA